MKKWWWGIWMLNFGLAQQAVAMPPFDFYVLSLSWSPEFCNVKPENRQCGRGYGFVLHGLWPQFTKGYPESCNSQFLEAPVLRSFGGLFPDDKLAIHEWKKHGTCSGLTAKDYLQLSQQLKNGFKSPVELNNLGQPLRVTRNELTQKIIAANPKLKANAVQFSCADGGRFLQEVYICYDNQGGAATACSPEMMRRSQKSCAQENFLIRNIR